MYQKQKELVIISQIDENRMLMNVIKLVDAIVVGVRKKRVKLRLISDNLLKAHIEKMSLFCLSKMFMKTQLVLTCNDRRYNV